VRDLAPITSVHRVSCGKMHTFKARVAVKMRRTAQCALSVVAYVRNVNARTLQIVPRIRQTLFDAQP
jgi:hypothetical protein